MKNTSKKMKKVLSIALCLAFVMSYIPLASITALGAEGVLYLNEYGNERYYTGEYTQVTSDLTSWANGWYVVNGEVTVEGRIGVSGTVNLILTDGAALTVKQGICVNSGNTFTIYAQSENKATVGKLTSTGSDYNAGIGGNQSKNGGTVIINGGLLTVTGGSGAAGIGGGYGGGDCGTVTINGGFVNVYAGRYAAGIGGGNSGYQNGGNGGNVTINGGEIYAKADARAAAIGGGSGDNGKNGYAGNGGTLTVNGGYVVADATEYISIGIGGGYRVSEGQGGNGANVTINDGIVIVKTEYGTRKSIGAGHSNADPGTLTTNGGMLFYDKNCTIYSDNITLTNDLVIEKDETLTINEGQSLTVEEGVSLINKGTIVNNGTIINFGIIETTDVNIYNGLVNVEGGVTYTEHAFENGFCTRCGEACTSHVMVNGFCKNGCASVYEPATEVNDKYDVNGDGYTDQVYEIANAGQLYWFAGLVNGTLSNVQQNDQANAVLTENIVVNENVLNDDYSLNGDGSNFRVWTPIGNGYAGYSGVFDGKGHTISGLYYNDTAEYMGLIGGCWVSSKIRNVGVIDTFFHTNSNVGTIVGQNAGTIDNCYAQANIKGYSVGGISGLGIIFNGKGRNISNCWFAGKVAGGKPNAIGADTNAQNCYYDNTLYTGTSLGTGKTSAEFASGEVAYLLNGSIPYGIWKQTLGEDAYPTFIGDTVYYGYSCSTEEFVGYANEKAHPTQPHYDENGYCSICKLYQPATLNADNYYEIYNVGQLYWFAEEVSRFDNDWNAVYNAILMNDIVINENIVDEEGNLTENTDNLREWQLIGNGTHTTFNGVFDGNYHTISGIYLDDTNASYSALFGSIGNGIVKNLGITDSYINGKKSAAFAGMSNGTIENCFVTDTVIKGESADSFAAVYSGTVSNYDYPCITKNSYSTALVYENGTKVDGALTNDYISENVCYLADSDNGTGGKTAEQFANGEVAYLLNGATSEGTLPWGQTIDTDIYPVWNGARVYKGYDCGGTAAYYSNSELLGENDNNHIHSNWTYSNEYGKHQRYICTREGCTQYQVIETEDCYGGVATCTEAAVCEVCHHYYGDYDYTNHTSSLTYIEQYDENSHKLLHSCCDTEIETIAHSYESYDFDSNFHWNACECGHVNNAVKAAHTFDANGFCSVCNGYEPASVLFDEDNYAYIAQIGNAGQLFWYAKNYSEGTIDGDGDGYGDNAGAILLNDIDLNPGYTFYSDGSYSTDDSAENYSPVLREWAPIKGFAWVDFDGQNHTVSGLYINTPEVDNVGMFAANDYYSIKNITLTNGYVYGGSNTGAIVGYNAGSIINCHSNIPVNGSGSIGGIVGYHAGSEISHCSNTGSVVINGYSSATGGIVGNVYGYSSITNCFNTGYIKGGICVGGIVGDGDDATISNCFNTGLVLSNFSDAHGITGHGIIENSYSLANEDDGAVKKTKAQFENGQVAYLLQNGNTEQVWGQYSNTPGSLPVFTESALYTPVEIGETGYYSVSNIGDVNSDATVDINDYQALVNSILAGDHEQSETAAYDNIIRCDLSGDGYLDAIDASLMHLLINGLKTVTVYEVGDFNANGVAFENSELSTIKHAIENPTKLSTAEKYACDINADGVVSEADLIALAATYGEIEADGHIFIGKKCRICGAEK